MDNSPINDAIGNISGSRRPAIHLIKPLALRPQSPENPERLGIFASSFNPVTTAHLALMRQAKAAFALDAMLALAGLTNADKSQYDCALADRLQMLSLALQGDAHTAIGISTHAFFVDMLDALDPLVSAQSEVYFILGFDTFERLLDPQDKYTRLYHRKFSDRLEALDYLLSRSRLLVAGRSAARHEEVSALCLKLPAKLSGRIFYLDFPDQLAEQSATIVRSRLRQGLSISGLVPDRVEHYIKAQGLYD